MRRSMNVGLIIFAVWASMSGAGFGQEGSHKPDELDRPTSGLSPFALLPLPPGNDQGNFFSPGDRAAVLTRTADMKVGKVVQANLTKGQQFTVTHVNGNWVYGTVAIDGQKKSGWVLARHVLRISDEAEDEQWAMGWDTEPLPQFEFPSPDEVKPLPPTPIPDDPPPHEGAMFELPYIVEPPDVVIIEVLQALPGRPITGERFVRPDGKISLDFYGAIDVKGLTLEQMKVKLILHLREFLTDEVLGLINFGDTDTYTSKPPSPRPPSDSDRVFVDVASYNSKFYYVEGEAVGDPVHLPCTGGETILTALHLANVMTNTARAQTVRLVRPARGGKPAKTYTIDLNDIIVNGNKEANLQLFPGDRLIVGNAFPQVKNPDEWTGLPRLEASKYDLGISCHNVLFQPVGGGEFYPGVQILGVFPDSPAAKAGLQPDGVQTIVRVDDKLVRNQAELVEALNDSDGTVTLKAWDSQKHAYIFAKDIHLQEAATPTGEVAP